MSSIKIKYFTYGTTFAIIKCKMQLTDCERLTIRSQAWNEWIGKKMWRAQKGYSKADVPPDAYSTYERESYAALLYGCLDFSIE